MQRSEEQIAAAYHLVPISVTQGQLMHDRQRSPVGEIAAVRDLLDDRGSSSVSTMSLLSYMNPYTPVRRMMLVHSTGTGKTRKSLLVALGYGRDVTIVAVHKIQSKLFQGEMQPGGVVSKLYPGFNKRVDAITCRSVVTAAAHRDFARLDFFFRDRVIIVDEMHHVRNKGSVLTGERSGSSLFDTVIHILSRYQSSIVLMLTATPLVDSVAEILGIWKLLRGDTPCDMNYAAIAYGLSGYVSKLDQKNLPTIETEVRCLMDPHGEQWRLYQKHQHDHTSVHSRTSAISRFATKDDSAASELDVPTSVLIDSLLSGRSFSSYEEYSEAALLALRSLSVKLYHLILCLRENRGHPHFIFDTWKKRGGIDRVLDVLTMPFVGYINVTTEQEALDTTRGPKLLALHKVAARGNITATSRLIDIFNSYDNREGALIDVILATPKFAESMSIRTAKYSHKLSCFWNLPGKLQVDGRSNRRSSLWYEPKENRVIHSFSYVLYQPDGGVTIESQINEQARSKFAEIRPVLDIMDEVKLERSYSDVTCVPGFMFPWVPINNRINLGMRMRTGLLSYRSASVNVTEFLAALEAHEDLYELMSALSDTESGYTRVISLAIQAVEKLYEARHRGDPLTPKQSKMLDDVSTAFTEYCGCPAHILYFVNTDTVEYQRMNRTDRRVLRVYSGTWTDVADPDTLRHAAERYNSVLDAEVEKMHDKWKVYGYYACRYLLTSCYRLVQYREAQMVTKAGYSHRVDNRKLSRGEKWQYYSKAALVMLLARLRGYSDTRRELIYRRFHVREIFDAILAEMYSRSMVVSLPL